MELTDTITIIGRTISQPFLLLTFIYYWRTTKFRYLYRMCFMNYLASLMISNFWNIWAIFNGYHKARPKYIFHTYNFIELSLLLWTNVLCYNFWQSIKTLILSNDNGGEKITYIKSLIYVWFCSLLYTVVGLVNDYLFDSQSQIYCTVAWVSFTFPVIILLSNVFMITHATIVIIKEMRAIITNLSELDTNNRNNDHRKNKLLMLYCKLFMVTIFLLCSKWFWFRLDNILHIKAFYLIFEHLMVGNSFQGIFIFLLFALKKKKVRVFKVRISQLLNERTTLCELNTSKTLMNRENSIVVAESIKNCNVSVS